MGTAERLVEIARTMATTAVAQFPGSGVEIFDTDGCAFPSEQPVLRIEHQIDQLPPHVQLPVSKKHISNSGKRKIT